MLFPIKLENNKKMIGIINKKSKFLFFIVHKRVVATIAIIKLITPVKLLDKIIAKIGNSDNPYQIDCFLAK